MRSRKPNPTSRATEARESFPGDRTANEWGNALTDAARTKFTGDLWVSDWTDEWIVFERYEVEADTEHEAGTYKATYTVDGDSITFGDAEKVEQHTTYEPAATAATEAIDRIGGRVLEAKGAESDGGRIFQVQIIESGTSRNGRRYPRAVLESATGLYEGAKAFDHHRTESELKTSSIDGLVGSFKNVTPGNGGLIGDLYLLPSATKVAEAFDASLVAQQQGLQPLVGISHDVLAKWQPVVEGGKRLQEATRIEHVLSADVVADPAAGGRAIRMVAGGDPTQKDTNDMNLKQLLAALREADATKRAELLKEHAEFITEWGLDEAALDRILTEDTTAADAAKAKADADAAAAAAAAAKEPETVGATEAKYGKTSLAGRALIREAVSDAELTVDDTKTITDDLADEFTEAELVNSVARTKRVVEAVETRGLSPRVVAVTKDAADKRTERLDAFFAGDYAKGYSSFKEAFCDFTASNPYSLDGSDFNRHVLRESIGDPVRLFDSVDRATESADTTTWAQALGDSITRRMAAEYAEAGLDSWRVVGAAVPVQDFRTQRVDRFGGYGTLPTVNEGAPYQPLASPPDEEATYAVTKKGGTEDITLEAIANDDVRLISRIPQRLGRAAARTLHDFVWDFLVSNATCTYDTTALFDNSHGNTTSTALANGAVNASRAKMRKQVGYGDASNILSLIPKTLIVVTDLEDLGNQITQGDRAVPSGTPAATDVPNLHKGLSLVVLDHLVSTTAWYLAASPADAPQIEVGFYQGRQDPELFTQTDPSAGSAWSSDKLSWKIRHVYGGTVIDHRGLQRGNV